MSDRNMERAAADLAAQIRRIRAQLADFDKRRGWAALGFPSFRAWAQSREDLWEAAQWYLDPTEPEREKEGDGC